MAVEALVCSHCRNVVGVRNAGSDPSYICHRCVESFGLEWMDSYLAAEENLIPLQTPLEAMRIYQEGSMLFRKDGLMGLKWANDALQAAAVAVMRGLITPGDAAMFRDETAALLGMLPSELVTRAVEVRYAN